MKGSTKIFCASCGKKTIFDYAIIKRTPKNKKYFLCYRCYFAQLKFQNTQKIAMALHEYILEKAVKDGYG